MDRPNTTDTPIEILFTEILPKLPVKSLLRFKTVSKSFKSLILSPTFIRLQRHHHSLSGDKRMLGTISDIETLYLYDLNSISDLPPRLSSTFRWTERFIHLLHSCNGFLLVYEMTQFRLILLNPSNRTYIDIDIPTSLLSENSVTKFIGLGFDDHNDNYKIVLISQEFTYPYNSYERVTLIYSVDSKSWKIVDRTTLPDYMYSSSDSAVVIKNNLMHWMIHKDASVYGLRPSRILCFDMCTETWKDDVLLPNHYYDPAFMTSFRRFGVLDGCLFSTFHNNVDSSTDIWVMKEYGVQESWTKLLTVSYSINLDGGVVPVAYRGGGSSEVLLRQCDGSKQVWYNLKDNTMKEARIQNFWGNQPCLCNESLVSLPGAKLFGSDEVS